MRMLKYNPNDHFQLNAPLLVIGVIAGIILGFTLHSASLLIFLPIISQYKWLIDCCNRIVYSNQIKALDRLTNSAKLADKRDNYTIGRYRNAVNYMLDMTNPGYYLLTVDSNGVTNTRNLRELANEVSAAFHYSANLQSVSNGKAIYRINIIQSKGQVNESDF